MKTALVEQVVHWVLEARHTIVLSGAGISTPSGIPDFRSPQSGLWQQTDPEIVASIGGFRRDPKAFYAWIRPLAQKIFRSEPNPAHRALADLEGAGLVKAVITQNIDGLHQKAGSRRVLELHGNLRQVTCLRCGCHTPTAAMLDAFLASEEVPCCPRCGGVMKPDVILYGELLPADVLREAEEEAAACDLMWVIGSSLTVAPASLLPQWAIERGARLVIANRTPTDLDRRAEAVLRDDVALTVPAVAEACRRWAGSRR